MVPIFRRAGQAAHVDAQDQSHVIHGHFGEEALEPQPLFGALGGPSLVLVDDQDSLLGPAQGHGMVGQGVLAFARLLMLEHLLWAGLPDVHDRQTIQMTIPDLGRAGAPDCRGSDRRHTPRGSVAGAVATRSWLFMRHLRRVRRCRQLPGHDAAECLQGSLSVLVGQSQPELSQQDPCRSLFPARGGTDPVLE